MRDLRPTPLLLIALFLMISFAGCGGSDDSEAAPSGAEVYEKQESKKLATQGTALTEEEKQKRAAESKARVKEARDSEKARRLLGQIQQAKDDYERAELIDSYGECGVPAAQNLDELKTYLKHESANVRIAAVGTFVKLRGRAARPQIEAAMADDDDDRVVVAGVQAWGAAGLPIVAKLYEFLEHYDEKVQYAALEVISAASSDAATIKRILAKSEDFTGATSRQAITLALTKKGELPGLAVLLAPMLEHQDPSTRVSAIRAMDTLGHKSAEIGEMLVLMLEDESVTRVAKESHKLLSKWAGAGAPPYDANAADEARLEQAAVWRNWLTANKADLK